MISVQHYDVRLDLTSADETFGSETTVRFRCHWPGGTTFIEFEGSVHDAELNGRAMSPHVEGSRLRLDGLEPDNSLTIRGTGTYSHDGTGLSRFRDPADGLVYLHSQFGEHETYRGFACFDQPDLKARFGFTVKAPDGWAVASNRPGSTDGGTWTFATTAVMPTYVTAIVAGPFHSVHEQHRNIPLGLYCRQSLAAYLDPDEIFEITRQGFEFFEQRFGYPYPFGKYDQIFVPDLNAGAMENAGCVTFNERRLFRSRVTDAERMDRAATILHEMAHMWFGDLVTMRWWDDLWLNESFAEYMGYAAVAAATPFTGAWTDFAVTTQANARRQDQLPTTHPIVAEIPDVEAVKLNLDSITYDKGAAALKQLVTWVGEDAFYAGLHEYLEAHAYANTELADFLAALEKSSGRALVAWSHAWLETAGVNTLQVALQVDGDRIVSATVRQTAAPEHPTLRPHRLRIGLFDLRGSSLSRRKSVELDISASETPVPELAGEVVPDLVLPNDGDLTYAKVRLDDRSLATATRHLRDMDDGLARAVTWAALWDMARDAQLPSSDYVAIAVANLDVETEAPGLTALIKQVESCIASFVEPRRRPQARQSLARTARLRLEQAEPGSDVQRLWSNALITSARADGEVRWVRGLLDGTTPLKGLVPDFALRWRAISALAAIGVVGEAAIQAELDRDPTDEGQKAAASARASRPDARAKQQAWEAVMADLSVPLAMKRAIAGGFHRSEQDQLLRAFVEPYFERLDAIWAAYDTEAAISIIEWMYPRAVVTQDMVDATDRALARDLPGPVRRCLLESQDAIKRALLVQAVDAAGTGSYRDA